MSETLNIPDICAERMAGWAKDLAAKNATPMLVIGVGHGPTQGEVHVFTMQEFSNPEVAALLAFALREINRRES